MSMSPKRLAAYRADKRANQLAKAWNKVTAGLALVVAGLLLHAVYLLVLGAILAVALLEGTERRPSPISSESQDILTFVLLLCVVPLLASALVLLGRLLACSSPYDKNTRTRAVLSLALTLIADLAMVFAMGMWAYAVMDRSYETREWFGYSVIAALIAAGVGEVAYALFLAGIGRSVSSGTVRDLANGLAGLLGGGLALVCVLVVVSLTGEDSGSARGGVGWLCAGLLGMSFVSVGDAWVSFMARQAILRHREQIEEASEQARIARIASQDEDDQPMN
jgi:hypothetical protein